MTVLERSEQLARRKELYEAKFPQTKKGVAGGLARHVQKAATIESTVANNESFVRDSSKKTGDSVSTIFQQVQIANRLDADVKETIRRGMNPLFSFHGGGGLALCGMFGFRTGKTIPAKKSGLKSICQLVL